ncbi:hypothetical protein L0156_03520 [bacterium]|nr:hypothetical protein [bacterium]
METIFNSFANWRFLSALCVVLFAIGCTQNPEQGSENPVSPNQIQAPDVSASAATKTLICHSNSDGDNAGVVLDVGTTKLEKHFVHGDCYYPVCTPPKGVDCLLLDDTNNDICDFCP